MTGTEFTKTSGSAAQHARLGPSWYLHSSVENDCAPPVERRGFGRALVRLILNGINERLRARRFRSPAAGADRPGGV
jgi:hypothetical protein